MPFTKRFAQIIDRTPRTHELQLWRDSWLVGGGLTMFVFLYLLVFGALPADVLMLNQAFANAGMVMIGLSFALSGLCYFWDFVDTKIIYRKHLGLVGFWLIMIHGVITLALPNFPLAAFFSSENIVAFLAAVGATLILVMMALISNQVAVRELGGKRWRALLRLGYLAYVFGIVHMAIKKYPVWSDWAAAGAASNMPPISLLVVLFAFVVIGLRLALWSSIRQSKTK